MIAFYFCVWLIYWIKLYILYFRCDLANEDEIIGVFAKIRDDFGRIDICINNAGFSSNSSLLSGQTDDWRNMMDVSRKYFAF